MCVCSVPILAAVTKHVCDEWRVLRWKQRDVGYYADGVNNFTLGKIIIVVIATVRVVVCY